METYIIFFLLPMVKHLSVVSQHKYYYGPQVVVVACFFYSTLTDLKT